MKSISKVKVGPQVARVIPLLEKLRGSFGAVTQEDPGLINLFVK
jgi:hypothetical protein